MKDEIVMILAIPIYLLLLVHVLDIDIRNANKRNELACSTLRLERAKCAVEIIDREATRLRTKLLYIKIENYKRILNAIHIEERDENGNLIIGGAHGM